MPDSPAALPRPCRPKPRCRKSRTAHTDGVGTCGERVCHARVDSRCRANDGAFAGETRNGDGDAADETTAADGNNYVVGRSAVARAPGLLDQLEASGALAADDLEIVVG